MNRSPAGRTRNLPDSYYSRRAAEYERIYEKPERQLSDGSRYRVMKNFLTKEELVHLGDSTGGEISIEEYDYFWLLDIRIT